MPPIPDTLHLGFVGCPSLHFPGSLRNGTVGKAAIAGAGAGATASPTLTEDRISVVQMGPAGACDVNNRTSMKELFSKIGILVFTGWLTGDLLLCRFP